MIPYIISNKRSMPEVKILTGSYLLNEKGWNNDPLSADENAAVVKPLKTECVPGAVLRKDKSEGMMAVSPCIRGADLMQPG